MPLWNEPYRDVDQYEIDVVTQVIHLNRKYSVGLGEIQVTVNGMMAHKGREYDEVDSYTIAFREDLVPGDNVAIEYLKMW